MSFVGRVARAWVPRQVKNSVRELHKRYVMHRSIASIAADPDRFLSTRDFDYTNLTYGWGNEGFSGSSEYLKACLVAARAAQGPILECGTGLSTLLLGVVAKHTGTKVWSLEHDAAWGNKVVTYLERFGIGSVRVCVSPLRDYGRFHWYDPPTDTLPSDFSMVVCDGPPGSTPGGRSGLLPVMRWRLRPGCVILLDDAERAEERAIAEQWAQELGTSANTLGDVRRYIELHVPEAL